MSRPHRLLANLLKGSPPQTLASLYTYDSDVSEKIFSYNVELRVTGPPPVDVPWPALWVLVNLSPKFRILSGAGPSLQQLSTSLLSQLNKLKWRVHFHDNPSEPTGDFYVKSRMCSAPPFRVRPDVEQWCTSFRSLVLKRAVQLRHSLKHKPNICSLVKIGIAALKVAPYYIVPNDKQPGFTFIPIDDLQAVESAALISPLYTPVVWEFVSLRSLIAQYRSLALRIGRHCQQPSTTRAITKSLSGSWVSVLGLTCKTHKDAGSVGMRTIHKSIVPAFDGLSRWIVSVLTPKLAGLEHLVKDSGTFVDRTHGIVVPPTAKLVCIDLKDFYLSGSPNEISIAISGLFQGEMAALVKEALYLLLDNQYIISSSLGYFYKCAKGAGIGLLHSAIVASLLYYIKVEKHFLDSSLFSNCLTYSRYHDDTFAVFSTIESLRECCRFIFDFDQQHIFIHECRDVGSSSRPVQMLDMIVSIDQSCLSLSVCQDKPLTPLCPSSCHVSHVHSSWPCSVISRGANQSKHSIHTALDRLIHRYELSNAHPLTIHFLAQAKAQVLSGTTSSGRVHETVCSLVLPFHPTFQRVVSRSLTILSPPELPSKLVIAWRNVLPSVAGLIVRANSASASAYVRQQIRDGGEGFVFLFSSSSSSCNTSLLPNNSMLSKYLALYACEEVQHGELQHVHI